MFAFEKNLEIVNENLISIKKSTFDYLTKDLWFEDLSWRQ